MVGDQQTHIMPAEPDELARVARLSGFADTDAFARRAARGASSAVETHYGALFEALPQPPESAPQPRLHRRRRRPRRARRAGAARLPQPAAAIAAVRAWQSGRYAATRSARARERLTEFLPLCSMPSAAPPSPISRWPPSTR